MERIEIINELKSYLTILKDELTNHALTTNEIKKVVDRIDRSSQIIHNNYLSLENSEFVDQLLYLIKAINHFYKFRRSVDSRIEENENLSGWIKIEIESILKNMIL